MKKTIYTFFTLLILTCIILITILSTIGVETDKFNKLISEKILEKNKNSSLSLKKIKFKLDVKSFDLFLETNNPDLNYKNIYLPLEKIKVFVDFFSLLKSKPVIDKINLESKNIDINKLKEILIKTKPSSINSLIINNASQGELSVNLELYFDANLKIKNYIAKGNVLGLSGKINNKLYIKETNFNFFADNTDILIKDIKSKSNDFLIQNGDLQINKDLNFRVKGDLPSVIKLNNESLKNYTFFLENNEFPVKDIELTADLKHIFEINFDQTYKVKNYSYNGKGLIKEFLLKPNSEFSNLILEEKLKIIDFKKADIELALNSNKKNYIYSQGLYKINNDEYQKFKIRNDFKENDYKLNIDFDFFQSLKIDLINYKKERGKIAKVVSLIHFKNNLIDVKKIEFFQENNSILAENLKLKKNMLISLGKVKVKTYEKKKLQNEFKINFRKKISIYGTTYDARNLSKILNKRTKNNFFKKLSSGIDINLKNVETPLSKKISNFRLIGNIEKGEFVKISSKGDFGNNKFLDISLISNKQDNKKYLEIYSDLPQPLLAEFNFFKGVSEGVLTYSSIIDGELSNSKIIIENFKIINAPGVVKLLSLADFGGLADLAEGEGLSFERLEIKMSNNKGFLKLNELYAVGPSISVLMEGYRDQNELTSLKGTLVPAKNLNKILSKIPLLGEIIIPKEVGEGLFGVSFKMKGYPGKIKTSINPIKTLTPRFITKALEKSKKTK